MVYAPMQREREGKTMRRKIMVVDDDVKLTRLLKHSLEKKGDYEVVVENASASAARRVSEIMPDLIVLDVVMPDKDGGDVAQAIRQGKRTKDIPIVFLSSIVSKEEIAARGGAIGGGKFLAKPATTDDLIAEIEAC